MFMMKKNGRKFIVTGKIIKKLEEKIHNGSHLIINELYEQCAEISRIVSYKTL